MRGRQKLMSALTRSRHDCGALELVGPDAALFGAALAGWNVYLPLDFAFELRLIDPIGAG
jgi:hypothetical protein